MFSNIDLGELCNGGQLGTPSILQEIIIIQYQDGATVKLKSN